MREQRHVTAEEFQQETGFDATFLLDFEAVKDRIVPRLMNGADKEYLSGKPHEWLVDMAVIYAVNVGEVGDNRLTAPVTDRLLSTWGVTIEEVHSHAMKNLHPVTSDLSAVLEEMTGVQVPEEMQLPVVVLTNPERFYGAAVILQEEVLKAYAEKIQGDVMIIPSSVHEVLLMPAADESAQGIARVIKEVNAEHVAPGDVLGERPYIYRRGEGIKAA